MKIGTPTIYILLCITSVGLHAKDLDIVGIWAMHPLKNGIANVTAYDSAGISYLYPFECSWTDGTISEEPVVKGTFEIEDSAKRIIIFENGRRIPLEILELSKQKMVLREDGRTWKYYRMDEVKPICDLEELKSLISEIDQLEKGI